MQARDGAVVETLTSFCQSVGMSKKISAGVTWHLYVVRTVKGSLYAGIATDVRRRYQEHVAGSRKAARFLCANPPKELAFRRRIGSRSLALKVEYRFKRLPKCIKETVVRTGRLHFDRESGEIRQRRRG